ncbi:DUF2145 domain-containing protein [Jeongeupia chitinilytica]|uniref:Membrane protein n=1 Tax=Jeongeupia chitinilytica TaxID=1041641 RepID=A0ABQ3GX93_9NEIS|nr:DUF2145 domain-containing protein [Jeongeupia chitinilytica]GHD57076.1 membrane protein [Jeongeupia chitinilytica]
MRCSKLVLAAWLGVAAASAWAGRPCSEAPPKPEVFRKAMAAGYASQQKLEQLQPQPTVALIARVGQDLSEYRMRYSHMAFVWRDPKENGQWRVAHLLNECGTAKSDLWREGLGNFFMDDMFAYDALILVPSQPVQERLQAWLSNPAAMQQLRGDRYSMVAYPFSTKYQNSNQWVLEGLAAAMSRDVDIVARPQAQQWLKLTGYQPSDLQIGTFKRLGGRLFRANVAFDDHPTDRRMSGHIDTVTVDSVVAFLLRQNKESRTYVVEAKPLPPL